MNYAIYIPNMGPEFGNPRFATELAVEAEAVGWDGFFIWDHIAPLGTKSNCAVSDPWVTLAAIAVRTTTLIIGTGVTPIPRRRPWKLARETVTLDHLSEGRLRLGVGIGTDDVREYSAFGEAPEDMVHAAMLDEGLSVLTGLWSAQPFSFNGTHYQVNDAHFLPAPLQHPRIPIWIAGFWPNKKPFRRAAQWDGVWVYGRDTRLTPSDIHEMYSYVQQHRTSTAPFDIVYGDETSGMDRASDAAYVASYAEAGVTWWVEGLSHWRGSVEEQRERLRRGPPRA